MIQFNLLPDIKIEYLKAKRQKQLVLLTSGLAVVASVVVMVVLISIVFVVQKKSISDLNKDITAKSSQLQGTKNLGKILTVQNQLNSLPALHSGKPAASRLFGYLQQVTPTAASISSLKIDFIQHTILLTGNADTLATVNNFTDTLKLATYHTDKSSKEITAFTSVVLSAFSRDSTGATYSITLQFTPSLFDITVAPSLTVPNVSARSSGQAASDLFKQVPAGQ
ncbi:MAG TPA: hypothetical protein VLF91_01220 [Candidatus Saccharimonadales bacterium]|nr:hypothetical protein [Candidatus Saccharimonadales bacterium]